MCGNVMNAGCDAPGADDDASGTAVVIELTCTMAKFRFPATLVFMAVAGEEQGLLGAAHWAKAAGERNVNVEAMITNDIVGSARDETGQRDAGTVRVFAEGVPAGKELSEEWQRRLETGVPLSKDDYLFSVRAVGAGGHRSLAIYPLQLRAILPPPSK
jgi:putative aminopeptidase FrvX